MAREAYTLTREPVSSRSARKAQIKDKASLLIDRRGVNRSCRVCGRQLTLENIPLYNLYVSNYICRECKRPENVKHNKNVYKKLKEDVFNKYGNCCACCGVTGLPFLTIEHIKQNGAAHRKELGMKRGWGFYGWLKRNNYPGIGTDYTTLCFNCNVATFNNGGICPHKEVVL